MNFGTLKTSVAGYLKDSSTYTTQIPDFIDQARTRLGAEMRCQANYVSGTVTSFASGLTALPTNLAELVSVVDSNGVPLVPMNPNEVGFNHDGGGVYAVVDTDLYVPDAGASTVITLTYYSIPTALVNDSDVVAGMSEYPSLWLYASVAEAARYVRDPDLEAVMERAYQSLLVSANRQGKRARHGPAPGVIDSGRNVYCAGPTL